jgi:hypothetical protein
MIFLTKVIEATAIAAIITTIKLTFLIFTVPIAIAESILSKPGKKYLFLC